MYDETKDFLPCGRPSAEDNNNDIGNECNASNKDSMKAIRDKIGRKMKKKEVKSTGNTTSDDERNDTKCDTELIGGKTSDE